MSFDDFAELMIKALIACMVILILCMPFIIVADSDREKEMIAKCTPNPNLYECQLYLAEKGKAAIQSAATTGSMTGAMMGSLIASGGRR